jgi:uncharacterized protein DUF3943
MQRAARAWIVGLVFAPLRVILAQDTTVVTPPPPPPPAVDSVRCGFCNRPNVFAAIFEGLLAQSINNRFNAWVLHDSTAYVTTKTWRSNLDRGWHFDEDNFVVNMLGHPYAGSLHFAGARSNGLSFWASAPFTFFHSAVWEYFGETTQPSINDFVDTGLGGIALGEMFHRVAATIRNNELGGGARVLRELAAIPFDPVGSFNRVLRGEWSRRGPNPSEHNPVATVLRTGGGAGIVRAPGSLLTSLKDAKFTSVLFAELKYGDAYIDSLRKPFDAFSARILLAPGHGGLTQLVGMGRIAGAELGRTEWHRHQVELNHRFEYLNNGALRFGAQTLELGLSSRVHLTGKFWLRTLLAGDGIALAGINAPGAGTGNRDYDFGPGLGGTFSVGFEHGGVPYLTGYYQPAWIHTVNGADANHYTSFAGVEASIPVLSQLDLVIQSTYYDRLSHYADGTRSHRRFPELRAFAAFKTAHRPAAAQ